MDDTGAEEVAAAAAAEEEEEAGAEAVPATRAKAVAKPKSRKKNALEPVSKAALGDFLSDGFEAMEAHEDSITQLKVKRQSIKAEQKKASRELKKARTKRAKIDAVLTRRPTWSLMAELQKRAASSSETAGSGSSTRT